MAEQSETPYATITRTGPNEIEVRFKPGILLDKTGIAEVIRERKRMGAGSPVGLLLIVPAETDLDMAMIGTDHLKVNQATDQILGFAVVARSAISEMLLRLYKAYYPTTFGSAVFNKEEEARSWLRERIAAGLEAAGTETPSTK